MAYFFFFKHSVRLFFEKEISMTMSICRYVPNPVKVLAEIKASGGDIDTVEGEIVAGDAADVDVVSMKGNFLF